MGKFQSLRKRIARDLALRWAKLYSLASGNHEHKDEPFWASIQTVAVEYWIDGLGVFDSDDWGMSSEDASELSSILQAYSCELFELCWYFCYL